MPNWKKIRKEWETSKITLAALAERHSVPLGTLKSRKSRNKNDGSEWIRGSSKKDATKTKKDATGKSSFDNEGNKKEPTSNATKKIDAKSSATEVETLTQRINLQNGTALLESMAYTQNILRIHNKKLWKISRMLVLLTNCGCKYKLSFLLLFIYKK